MPRRALRSRFLPALLLSTTLVVLAGCPSSKGEPLIFEIPAGYTGWIVVRYGVPGAPALVREDKAWVIRIDANGTRDTATLPVEGRSGVDFYEVDAAGARTKLDRQVGWQEDMTWDHRVACCFSGTNEGTVRVRRFYVGMGPPGPTPK